ncbi:MAG TPA: protein-glutamate O-methyltransferase CheR [Phycisphaerae bacterium]|nr:protein-glutamate O-methyltransferase CheR [Phycisphaerae bacterium]
MSLAGIELFERHRDLLLRRSSRIGIVDPIELDSLLQRVEKGDPDAQQKFFCLLTTKFTGFFRHPRHFAMAAQHAMEAVRRNGRARLWSAGAATGEEPYSLAIAVIEVFQRDDLPINILATDVDVEALEIGRRGEYSETALRGLEPSRRQRFLGEDRNARRFVVADALRQLVDFRALNLADEKWPIDGPLDVIFCRNVLMYLETGLRHTVVERMASLLAPGGLLMLDPTEHLGKAGHLFESRGDGVYSLRGSSPTPRGGA